MPGMREFACCLACPGPVHCDGVARCRYNRARPRGPVQDESRSCDPVDAAGMAVVEGRAAQPDSDLLHRDALARQAGVNLDGSPRRETLSPGEVA